MTDLDLASAILRLSIGATMLAHGLNHAFGGGKLAGTASWFESIGIRPGRLHALAATVTEVAAGLLLLLGLFTALAAAATVGTMIVAFVANHRTNGFFIFRPGEGYEYVLMIAATACAVAALGAGRVSLDEAIGLQLAGWAGLLIAAGGGLLGAAGVLSTSWRPGLPAAEPTSAMPPA